MIFDKAIALVTTLRMVKGLCNTPKCACTNLPQTLTVYIIMLLNNTVQ